MNLYVNYCKIREVFEGYNCDERFHRLDDVTFYGDSHSELIDQARKEYGTDNVTIKEISA